MYVNVNNHNIILMDTNIIDTQTLNILYLISLIPEINKHHLNIYTHD